MEKIKLAFICKFSNAEIRRHQTIKDFRFENFLLALLKKEKKKVIDYGPWIPLFLKAFENDNNIEVHVIAPYSYQKKKLDLEIFIITVLAIIKVLYFIILSCSYHRIEKICMNM